MTRALVLGGRLSFPSFEGSLGGPRRSLEERRVTGGQRLALVGSHWPRGLAPEGRPSGPEGARSPTGVLQAPRPWAPLSAGFRGLAFYFHGLRRHDADRGKRGPEGLHPKNRKPGQRWPEALLSLHVSAAQVSRLAGPTAASDSGSAAHGGKGEGAGGAGKGRLTYRPPACPTPLSGCSETAWRPPWSARRPTRTGSTPWTVSGCRSLGPWPFPSEL